MVNVLLHNREIVCRQLSPPVTTEDEAVGRSAPVIGVPDKIGDALIDVSSLVLAVAEWIIDPRQARATSAVRCNARHNALIRRRIHAP